MRLYCRAIQHFLDCHGNYKLSYSGFTLRSNFPYPVNGKFMVGFSIELNQKTNHKLPMYRIRKFERKVNSL